MKIREMLTHEWQNVRHLRYLNIQFDAARCTGTWQCVEVCPIGCWTPNPARRVVAFHGGNRCVACGACVLQCREGAIKLALGSPSASDLKNESI